MKVLWIIDSLGPGGAEGLMLPLLKNLDRDTVESRVCVLRNRSGNPIADELKKIGIPVDLLLVKNLRGPFNLRRLIKYIRHYQPDLIHTQLETSDVLGTVAARYLQIPSVSTVHTLDVPSKRRRTYWRNLLRWSLLKLFSKRVITVSESTRQHYVELGFKESKLLTMYNGIDLSLFSRDRMNFSERASLLGLPSDSVVMTTVAVLREQKGIQYMLRALPELLRKVPKLYYVIVGDGAHRESLEKLAKSLGIEDRVILLGHRTDIPRILSASDLFVFPTLQDALPTVLFEAMAAGLPIIASEVGGVPEILDHDVDGLLIPPRDVSKLVEACLCLLNNRRLSDRLSVSARKTVEDRFDIRQQVRCLVNLYDQIVVKP